MEFYGGIENWIKLFVDKASKQLNGNKKENSDGSLKTTSTLEDESKEDKKEAL